MSFDIFNVVERVKRRIPSNLNKAACASEQLCQRTRVQVASVSFHATVG
jgi:hypothetical protein